MKMILIIWLAIGSMMCYDLFKSASANEIELTLGGWSAHFGQPPAETKNFINDSGTAENKTIQGEYNEVHNTIGIRYGSYEYSTFKNSYFKRSHMVSYHPRYDLHDNFKLGLRGGLVTGYTKTVKAFIQPTATVYYKAVGAEFGWLPDMNSNHPYGIFTLTGKVRF